jgi:hypothetical protein
MGLSFAFTGIVADRAGDSCSRLVADWIEAGIGEKCRISKTGLVNVKTAIRVPIKLAIV